MLQVLLIGLLTKPYKNAIHEAGFEPQLRNQQYEWREIPETIVEQVVNY